MEKNNYKYKILSNANLTGVSLTLRQIEPVDIESIRNWRNNQMDVLRQSNPIKKEEQHNYFTEFVWSQTQLSEPSQIIFMIELDHKPIGYGGIVHISWPYKRGEISFLLEPKIESNGAELEIIFEEFLGIIKQIAFNHLNLQKLTTETYSHRLTHIRTLEKAGFNFEGRLRNHVVVDGRFTDALVHGAINSISNKSLSSKKDARTVLVSSASCKIPLIKALKEASARLTEKIIILAGDVDHTSPAQYEADLFWEMPSVSDHNLMKLIEGCLARQVAFILPTRDGELEFWARHKDTFAQYGIKVLVSELDPIKRCRDKLAFSKFAIESKLSVIETFESPDCVKDDLFVVKERFGSGSVGVGLRLSKLEAIEHARNLENPVFQPFISGEEISIDAWISATGLIVGVVLRQRNRIVFGESQVTTTFRNSKFELEAINFLKKLQLQGPVVMQAIVNSKGLIFIECNPRFGGASSASIGVGLDSLYWTLSEAVGEVQLPNFCRANRELRQVRMPVDSLVYDFNI